MAALGTVAVLVPGFQVFYWLLHRAMPKVAAHLQRFYGPSPLVAHLPAHRIP